MKILPAGAAGIVGHHVVPMLVGAGYDVIGTTRSAAKATSIAASGARPCVVDASTVPAFLPF